MLAWSRKMGYVGHRESPLLVPTHAVTAEATGYRHSTGEGLHEMGQRPLRTTHAILLMHVGPQGASFLGQARFEGPTWYSTQQTLPHMA